jgi:Phage integrase, N-terminal SAM-like domain
MVRRRTFGYVRRLPSGRWQASYLDERNGERVGAPATFATKVDANLWLASVETDLARGEHLRPELARRPFGEWADEWLHSLHVKPKTYVGYESSLRNHVLPVFADRPIADVTYRDCKAFVDGLLRDGLAPGTAGEARKVLRLVLGEALRSDAIRRNPADGLRIPRGMRQEMVFLSPGAGHATRPRDRQAAEAAIASPEDVARVRSAGAAGRVERPAGGGDRRPPSGPVRSPLRTTRSR